MTRGLVIGKFYPPHKGHRHLIATAAAQADHVDVLVCWREEQAIPGETRAAWIRRIHAQQPNIRVIAVWDFGDDTNSEAWANRTEEVLGYVPDVVFTSESYGASFAEFLGARHVSVDPERLLVPVSGTAVRADPFSNWHFLDPPVRAHYAVRVAVVGAESTGTTTLAGALADHYRTVWVPEYGREYCEQLQSRGIPLERYSWKTEDFVHIAQEQQEREDEYAGNCNRLLICDTDALATSIWHERYVGSVSQEVRALADSRRYDLYILTDCDIPFVQDGLRDGEHLRDWMTERFRHELTLAGTPWICVAGNREDRIIKATTAVDRTMRAAADRVLR